MSTATILFACVHNAGRSPMAAAFFNSMADPGKAVAVSAGTEPLAALYPAAVTVMQELGMDISGWEPKRLTEEMAAGAQMLITMGCGDDCPAAPGVPREDWPIEDPGDLPMDRVRRIQELLLTRVMRLIDAQGWR